MRKLVLVLAVAALVGCGDAASPSPSSGPAKGSDGVPGPLTDLQKLLDTMPKESQPRADKDGVIERNEANQWVKTNLVGKPLAVSATASEVVVTAVGDTYDVRVRLGEVIKDPDLGAVIITRHSPGKVRAGGAEWTVHLQAFRLQGVDQAMAKRLRDLKGKRVTARGVFAEFFAENVELHEFGGRSGFQYDPTYLGTVFLKGPVFCIALKESTIDGIGSPKK